MKKTITFEQAKRLKSLGYNYYDYEKNLCQHVYNNVGEILERGSSALMYNSGEEFDCPSVYEALDYIRDARGIICAVELAFGNYQGVFISSEGIKNAEFMSTHIDACLSLLDYILKYLEIRQ